MIRHNTLIAYRNSLRYKSSLFINLIGLSTGLACVIMIFLWVNDELQMDQFHANGDRLYQMLENVDQGTGMITRYSTSGPTAEALATEMPEVEMATTSTLQWGMSFVASTDDLDITTKGLYADVDSFRMFSYALLQGDAKQVLSDKKNVVISEALSKSLFGKTDDVVGKTITLNHDKQYQVSGIMKDI